MSKPGASSVKAIDPVQDRQYWYFDTAKGETRCSVGPTSNAAITARVKTHQQHKDDLRARRTMVSSQIREGA
jgi:hypothetical protein